MAADYLMTSDLLASHQVIRPVSEIHGVLCGQLCAGSAPVDLELCNKILELEGHLEEVITNLFKLLAEDIQDQLQAEDYSFQPLLPDDDEDFNRRLAALADWCDGFNAGFAGAWVRDETDMLAETREVLEDFSRIAFVENEDDGIGERENEVNFMEILEYVRMAVITVYLQNRSRESVTGDPGVSDLDQYIH